MNGVAISLYDKFEELAVLVDIIRHNWSDDYFISVCSNHPDAEERMADINVDVDHFEQGAQIAYIDPEVGQRGSRNLNYRIYDTLRTACRPAITNEDVEYFMHLHADAWQLSEAGFDKLLEEMDQRDDAVAFPARMQDFLRVNPPGYFYDQFIVFDAHAAREVDLFNHSTLEFFPESIHQTLAMICIVNFGWSNIFHYANGTEREHWDGLPLTEVSNHARPMFHDPEYHQIHVATEDFENELGEALQAHYLERYEVDAGPNLREHLKEYLRPKEELFEDLNRYLSTLNQKLQWYGLSADMFGREIRLIREFLSEPLSEKIKWAIYLHTKNTVVAPLVNGIYEMLMNASNSVSVTSDREHSRGRPESVTDLYLTDLNGADFPPELKQEFEDVFYN